MTRWPGPNYYEPAEEPNHPCEDGHLFDDPDAYDRGEVLHCLRCDEGRGVAHYRFPNSGGQGSPVLLRIEVMDV